MKKTTNNTKKNTNYINTAAIGNKLHQHLVERAKLQQKMDELWEVIKRYNCNRCAEMSQISRKMGENTYAIDGLINQLIRAGGRSTKAHYMAIDYLKREIARNQRIVASRDRLVRAVQRGETYYINSEGITHRDVSGQMRYVAKKKQKIAQLQRMLSQLQNPLRRAS